MNDERRKIDDEFLMCVEENNRGGYIAKWYKNKEFMDELRFHKDNVIEQIAMFGKSCRQNLLSDDFPQAKINEFFDEIRSYNSNPELEDDVDTEVPECEPEINWYWKHEEKGAALLGKFTYCEEYAHDEETDEEIALKIIKHVSEQKAVELIGKFREGQKVYKNSAKNVAKAIAPEPIGNPERLDEDEIPDHLNDGVPSKNLEDVLVTEYDRLKGLIEKNGNAGQGGKWYKDELYIYETWDICPELIGRIAYDDESQEYWFLAKKIPNEWSNADYPPKPFGMIEHVAKEYRLERIKLGFELPDENNIEELRAFVEANGGDAELKHENGEKWVYFINWDDEVAKISLEHDEYWFYYVGVWQVAQVKASELYVYDGIHYSAIYRKYAEKEQQPEVDSEIVVECVNPDAEFDIKVEGNVMTGTLTPDVTSEKIGENEWRIMSNYRIFARIDLDENGVIKLDFVSEHTPKQHAEAERIFQQKKEKTYFTQCIECESLLMKEEAKIWEDDASNEKEYLCKECYKNKQEREVLVKQLEKYRKVGILIEVDVVLNKRTLEEICERADGYLGIYNNYYDDFFDHLIELLHDTRNQKKVNHFVVDVYSADYCVELLDKEGLRWYLHDLDKDWQKGTIKKDILYMASKKNIPGLEIICDLILCCKAESEPK